MDERWYESRSEPEGLATLTMLAQKMGLRVESTAVWYVKVSSPSGGDAVIRIGLPPDDSAMPDPTGDGPPIGLLERLRAMRRSEARAPERALRPPVEVLGTDIHAMAVTDQAIMTALGDIAESPEVAQRAHEILRDQLLLMNEFSRLYDAPIFPAKYRAGSFERPHSGGDQASFMPLVETISKVANADSMGRYITSDHVLARIFDAAANLASSDEAEEISEIISDVNIALSAVVRLRMRVQLDPSGGIVQRTALSKLAAVDSLLPSPTRLARVAETIDWLLHERPGKTGTHLTEDLRSRRFAPERVEALDKVLAQMWDARLPAESSRSSTLFANAHLAEINAPMVRPALALTVERLMRATAAGARSPSLPATPVHTPTGRGRGSRRRQRRGIRTRAEDAENGDGGDHPLADPDFSVPLG